MLELGKKMFSMSLQWAGEEGRCLNRADARVLQDIFSTTLSNMKVRGRKEVNGYKVDITEKGKETNPARSWKRWEGQRIRPE